MFPVISLEPKSYYPLSLNWDTPNRKWALNFQLRPTPLIEFSGDEPTRDEIIQCLALTNAPVWMIEIIEICVAVATRETSVS